MTQPATRIVCLFDCDNTLLDNDALKADLDARLRVLLGDARADRFWMVYEAVRQETGVVDYPLTVSRLRPEFGPTLADQVWQVIWNYPFPELLYPASLAVLRHLRDLGCEVGIISDGDMVYQPHKIAASGLEQAVNGHVKIYAHKQAHLAEILAWLPGDHYVFVDDRATILSDIKIRLGARTTTIHVLQGHYSDEVGSVPPDVTIQQIGDLLGFGVARLLGH